MDTIAIIGRIYQQSFDARPHLTLATANGTLSAIGDVVAQSLNKAFPEPNQRPIPYDIQRTVRFFCFGVGMGPIIGRWNQFLEHTFPLRTNSRSTVSMSALAKRVFFDQTVMAPIGIAMFLGSMGVMEGRSNSQLREKYSSLFFPALLANWKVWPAAQLINFRYMPLPYRVPFSQSCGVFWTLYLSLLNAKQDKAQDTNDKKRQTIDA
ncbi:hypothetical protein SISNIDRAFT_451852 [Sistotremastrum niveocremeum HHB9708]|uniref:Protein sym1 n=1 Tax=Sistotremastrum niveocremeum HHB9708 TaxID=1314777 RepID=A0A164XNU6_9AGAM|nr:hypothetical protein SISNIDRAFT_451852 [Sistotremastrum niveocremeum HHB9708]